MKKIFYLFILTAFFSCSEKKNGAFTVLGTIKNGSSKMVFLEEDIAGNQQPVVVDSAVIKKDGSFTLSAPSKEQTMFSLRSDASVFPFALIINDSKKVEVTADLSKKQAPYTVSGSEASQGIINYDKYIDEQAQKIAVTGKQVDSFMKSKSPDTIVGNKYAEFTRYAQDMKSFTSEFVEKSNSPVLALYVIGAFQRMSSNLGIKGYTDTELAEIINKQSSKYPENVALNDIKEKLKPRKAIDFSMADTSGHPVSLSSFRGKYVLVDFWASWCGPCRGENPNVVKAYNQFKNKNFTVLGVSLDKEKNAWIKAIKDDGLAWTQVSDLKFWNNAAAAQYGVNSIPYNVLIDPNGNIIGEELRGQDLVNVLNKVLK